MLSRDRVFTFAHSDSQRHLASDSADECACLFGSVESPESFLHLSPKVSAYFEKLGEDFMTSADANSFEIQDRYSPAHFKANLDRDGIATISVVSRDSKGEVWSETFNATEAYENMIAHFSGRLNGIKSEWLSKQGWSTNLEQLNSYLKTNSDLSSALLKTWSGRRASEAGFSRATLLKVERNAANEVTRVLVLFER